MKLRKPEDEEREEREQREAQAAKKRQRRRRKGRPEDLRVHTPRRQGLPPHGGCGQDRIGTPWSQD